MTLSNHELIKFYSNMCLTQTQKSTSFFTRYFQQTMTEETFIPLIILYSNYTTSHLPTVCHEN